MGLGLWSNKIDMNVANVVSKYTHQFTGALINEVRRSQWNAQQWLLHRSRVQVSYIRVRVKTVQNLYGALNNI